MDSIIQNKNTIDHKNSNSDHIVKDESQDFLDGDDYGYHVLELGRSYKRGDVYHERFLGKEEGVSVDVQDLLNDCDEGCDDVSIESVVDDDRNILYMDHIEEFQEDEDDDVADDVRFSLLDLPIFTHESVLHSNHVSRRFALVGIVLIFILSFGLFVGTAFAVKNRVMNASERAIVSMRSALMNLQESDVDALNKNIDTVHNEFLFASEELDKINPVVTFMSRFIPGTSKLSSGTHIVEAGKYLSHTATEFGDIIPAVVSEKDISKEMTFLELYQLFADRMSTARYDVAHAQKHIDKVYIDDIPAEYRSSFVQIRELLPQINKSLQTVTESRPAVEDMLGANGPRTYLLLFQNNHEMRATGGFIGSYGIVRFNKGKIEKMFVDDVYNPDGQLIDRVVPPLPIQKISADWSLHDSNWFVDFPVSAKKAIDFYERTGGPTVDGVIAITPSMMEKILKITGPIELSEHDLVLTHENFVRTMQDKVEDRESYTANARDDSEEENVLFAATEDVEQPKAALGDLMPEVIERLSQKTDPHELSDFLVVMSEGLKERHIVMYTSNEDIQEIIEDSGWGGEVLQTDKDYLSIVNTNINGFKTDGVVDEMIEHSAQIDQEGYIVNTVKVKRMHTGGHTGYPWWDAVNADYMRMYVPQGSQLLSVEGHTREINEERLDYDALGYERDPDVENEESRMKIDEETGTRIYDEYNKTVFANWVYVSPQENVTVTYKYRLPFRVKFYEDDDGLFGSYAVIFQKQSGSIKSRVKSQIVLDNSMELQWHSHDSDTLSMENNLMIDRYNGAVFKMKD